MPYYPPSQQEQDMAELVERRIRKELHKLTDTRSKIGVLNSAALEEIRTLVRETASQISGHLLEREKQELKLLQQVYMAGVLDIIEQDGRGVVMDTALSELNKRDKLMEYGEILEHEGTIETATPIATEIVKIFDKNDTSRVDAEKILFSILSGIYGSKISDGVPKSSVSTAIESQFRKMHHHVLGAAMP